MFRTQITAKRLSFHAVVLALGFATTLADAQNFLNVNVADATFQLVPQPITRNVNPSKSVGNSYAGASINFPIQISNENGCRLVKVVAKSTVRLLKKSGTAAEFEASVKSCSNGTRTGTVKAKIASFTLAVDNSSVSFSWQKNFTKTLISASTTVWVGPVPVTVKGSAAGTLSAKLSLSITGDDVGLSGPLSFSIKGTASGSIGVTGFNIGLEVILELLKSTLTPSLKATTATVSGTIQLCFEPLIIKLNLKASAWPFSWTENLANYSLAKECRKVL